VSLRRAVRQIRHRVVSHPQPPELPTVDRAAVAEERTELARWADYFAVAASLRFRASQRRHLRGSARTGMILVVVAALLNCVWLVPFHPADLALVVGLNAAVALAAAVAALWIAARARCNPEPPVFTVLVIIDVATVALGIDQPRLGLVAAGYLLLLPTIVALIIPWSTRHHVAWLAVHVAFTLAYSALAAAAALPGGRDEKLTLLVMATAASQLGHVTALRARVLSFVQIERIRALNREGRRNAERLDHLNAVLERTALMDELTGLRNRLSLRRDLRAIRARIARHGERYGLLMFDLDRFKAVNDALGHVAGDGVLRAVGESLIGVVRAEDGAYRYGGEEFVVAMEVTEPHEELLAAERIRRVIEGLDLPNPGNPPYGRVTVSVGVARVGPDDLAADDDDWFGRADAAMYLAKADGRNRCEGEFRPVGPVAGAVATAHGHSILR
jgi:diguanylate cyclase (GGDEF)-like protein